MFSKSLESALSAMALLAEQHASGRPLTAGEIASDRALHRPFVAKLLTALAQGGLVQSKPGRNGGFLLAREPAAISLLEIASAVGYRARIRCCVFGPDYGDDAPRGHCGLHQEIVALRDQIERFLGANTLASFAAARPPGRRARRKTRKRR